MKTLEIKAANVDEAIEKGLLQLGKTRDQVEVEVLDKGGLIKKARVVLTVKQEQTAAGRADMFLDGLFSRMSLDVTAEIAEDEDKVSITISGKDSGSIIGYRGDVLDAVQYLTSLAANTEGGDYKKVVIDCENYREKRSDTLKSLAEKLAEKAVRSGRKIYLEPMNPFERRIIHAALHENTEVTTGSEGTEPNRFIVITPKDLKYDGPSRYGRDSGRKSYSDGRSGGFRDRGERGGRDSGGRDSGGRDSSRERSRGDGRGTGSGRQSARKSSSFSSFGTYLGNTRSGFSGDNDFTKKSGFDNLKD